MVGVISKFHQMNVDFCTIPDGYGRYDRIFGFDLCDNERKNHKREYAGATIAFIATVFMAL